MTESPRNRKILVLANPRAGGGRVFRKMRKIHQWLNETGHEISFEVPLTQDETVQHAAKAKAQGFDTVIAMGGDGTVKDVLEGATGTGIQFGIIPGGRGNDLARNAGYPSRLKSIVRGFKNPGIRTIDVPTLNSKPFGNVGGAGFDSAVVALVTDGKCKLPGTLCYYFNVFRAVIRFKPIHMRVTIDDHVHEGNYTLCTIANGEDFGGGMKVAPGALVDDGELDICLVEDVSATRLLKIFPTVYKGKHLELPEVSLHRGKRILIETETPTALNYDGDFAGTTPGLFEVGQHSIEMVVPGK
jgi:YegS/Rv2252/BmrU family lipid kinase